jgi:hypothetical protein
MDYMKKKKIKKQFINYAESLEGIYYSHKSDRLFEVTVDKIQKHIFLVNMIIRLDDGEVIDSFDLPIEAFTESGVYEKLISYSEL